MRDGALSGTSDHRRVSTFLSVVVISHYITRARISGVVTAATADGTAGSDLIALANMHERGQIKDANLIGLQAEQGCFISRLSTHDQKKKKILSVK